MKQCKVQQTQEQLLAFLVQVDEQALMSSLHRLIGTGRVAVSRAADVYHDVKKARCAMKRYPMQPHEAMHVCELTKDRTDLWIALKKSILDELGELGGSPKDIRERYLRQVSQTEMTLTDRKSVV